MGVFKNLFKRKTGAKEQVIEENINLVEDLFDELKEIFIKKERIKEYLSQVTFREEQIKKFEVLEKEDIEKLSALAGKAKEIEEQKQSLKGRLIRNNKSLFIVSQHEEEVPELLREMQNFEKKKIESERNIYYLEEEKEELFEERESLLKGYQLLKVFSIFFMVVMGIGLLVAFGYMQKLREEIWVYLTGFSALLIVFLVGILYAKERIEKELAKNTILQQKAVRYLNKSKIRYFHQVRYLNFEYQKLGVDSAAKLEMYYNRYLKNKDNEKTYSRFNHMLSDIEEDMLAILKSKGIEMDYIDNLSDWMLSNKKVNSLKTLEEDEERTKEQLEGLETYEADLWKEVFLLQEDEEVQGIIQYKLRQYEALKKGMLDKIPKDA